VTSNTVKVTTKGQVTIPQPIRERLGMLPNCEVEFDIVGDSVRIRKAGTRRRGERLLAAMRKARTPGMTTDQIMALTRGE
jgi:AbrB family looped-hinge helix DNA binding protein